MGLTEARVGWTCGLEWSGACWSGVKEWAEVEMGWNGLKWSGAGWVGLEVQHSHASNMRVMESEVTMFVISQSTMMDQFVCSKETDLW